MMKDVSVILFYIFLIALSVISCVVGLDKALEEKCPINRRAVKYNPIYRTTCWLFEEVDEN